jgi:prepilin-type N-terminal cleavage/methylation domain-containing protein
MNRARTRFSIQRQPGFSLVELIVVIVVLGIIASMGAIVVRDGMLGYLRGREITSADWQGRLALERITRDLRDIAAPNYSNISACGGSSFTYSDINFSQISYTLISDTQGTNTLLRNGTQQPLADGVSYLNFSCFTSNVQPTATLSAVYYISVSMVVATTNTRATYRGTVKPGNF